MDSSLAQLCRRYGLTYVATGALDIRRRRCGKGFTYINADGKTVRDKNLRARIKALAIPPAWSEVCVASADNAHIQAIGRDGEGRLQYRYHPEWERLRSDTKKRRLLSFGTSIGRVRREVTSALSTPGLGRRKLVAAVVRLIDRALLRPGHETYARLDGGRGAATLTKNDVDLKGDKVLLSFPGKGGKVIEREVQDPLLARMLRSLRKLKGRRLFKLPSDARPVTAQEVNDFLAEVSGAEVTAKDFRTFRASAKALEVLAEEDTKASESPATALARAADTVSETLVNTRAVARSSYIHPIVIDTYKAGRLRGKLLHGSLMHGLNRFESALVRLLKSRAA